MARPMIWMHCGISLPDIYGPTRRLARFGQLSGRFGSASIAVVQGEKR
jgi:hypothetical protein